MKIVDINAFDVSAEFDRFVNEIYPNYSHYAFDLPRQFNIGYDDKVANFALIDDGRVLGRLAMMWIPWVNKFVGEEIAYFTAFESVRSDECVRALFSQAKTIARSWGANKIRGPMTPFISDVRGILTSNYDLGPTIGLAFNPPYYDELFDAVGLKTIKHLYSYVFQKGDMDHLDSIVNFVKRRNKKIILEEMDFGNISLLTEKIVELYNVSWINSWHFIPLQRHQVQDLIERSLSILTPSMNFFLLDRGCPVGIFMSLPNIHLSSESSGSAYRGMLFGVHPKYRKKGLEIVMAYTGYQRAISMGMSSLEIGWVLESNSAWVRQIRRMLGDAHIRKVFKLYEINV